MKKIFKNGRVAGFLAIAMVMLNSNCTKLTDGYSTDPVNLTNPTQIDQSKYMNSAEVAVMGIFEGDQARQTGMWTGYFDGEDRQYLGLQSFVTSGQDYDVQWRTIYSDLLKNSSLLKQNAQKGSNNVAVGIAQVLEGMSLGVAADMWGDIPYTEKTQFPVITTPVFDKQSAVYAAIQVLLDSAVANLNLPGSANGDFLMGANKAAWIGIAHTVKARLYLHTRDYANAIAQANVGISSAATNLMALHAGAYLQTFNLYYSFCTYDRSGYMAANAYAPQLLDAAVAGNRNNAKTNEAARLNYIYKVGGGLNFAPAAGTYEPNVLCNDFAPGTPTTSDGFFGAVTSFPITTWQENQLILAEALMKQATPDPTNALNALNSLRAYYATGAHVNSGYLAKGYNYAAYALADFAPGGIDNNGTDDQNTALLREILEERYVTLIGQLEGWTDMRRTGNFLKLPLPAGKTDYPRRGLYSQVEVNTNPNVPTDKVGLYDPVSAFSTAY